MTNLDRTNLDKKESKVREMKSSLKTKVNNCKKRNGCQLK